MSDNYLVIAIIVIVAIVIIGILITIPIGKTQNENMVSELEEENVVSSEHSSKI